MTTIFEQVRAALEAEEPDYEKTAREFGSRALPHLERMLAGDNVMLASKAAYLASIIGTAKAILVIERAASSSDVRIRVAAAAAARNLPPAAANAIALNLLDDVDAGVRKVALKSIPEQTTDALRSKVKAMSTSRADSAVRNLARLTLARLKV